MFIKESDFNAAEHELLEIADADDSLYDQAHFFILKKVLISGHAKGEMGVFKVFQYKNSLRFFILFQNSPSTEIAVWLAGEVMRHVKEAGKETNLLWYSQREGFSETFLKKLPGYENVYYFFKFHIKRNDISTDVDMKGLTKCPCSRDMIDVCIDILEDVFTPIPDPPGSFRNDRERIASDFLSARGGTELFYKDEELIGFCGHVEGHFTETVVRKEYQGKGFGEVIVRSVLQSVYDLGYDAELTTGRNNDRAIALYKKAGFIKVYESVRVNLA